MFFIAESFLKGNCGIEPKNGETQNIFWKKGWAYRFVLDASEIAEEGKSISG